MASLFQQYLGIKKKYPDAVLLIRQGDYYEMFNEDVKIAAKHLGLAATTSEDSNGTQEKASLPHLHLDWALRKLAKAGIELQFVTHWNHPKTSRKKDPSKPQFPR